MALEDLKEHAENIQNHTQEYIESSLSYYKLHGFKLAMKSMTIVAKTVLIFFCFLMFLLFCSLAGAYAIGEALNDQVLGFLVVGGIYMVLLGVLYLVRNKIVEGPIIEKFSEIFFNE